MRIIIILICAGALGLAATLAALGPGTRFGLWDYSFALGLMRTIALPLLIAAGFAVIALALAAWRAQGLVALAFLSAIAAGAAGYAPIRMRALAEGNPFIHDVTTDFENPPAIAAAADAPRKNPPAYAGADVVRGKGRWGGMMTADAQRDAFPEIAPFRAAVGVDAAAAAAREVIADMKMEIIADTGFGALAGNGRLIEAVATSFWFGFKDDFIVRVTPEGEGRSRIDLRSKSRVGGSDLGANAARVREFLSKIKARIPPVAGS